jgi:hypothetical protein
MYRQISILPIYLRNLSRLRNIQGVKAVLGDKDAYRVAVANTDAESEEQEASRVMMLECE